jgi:hypothetical protein
MTKTEREILIIKLRSEQDKKILLGELLISSKRGLDKDQIEKEIVKSHELIKELKERISYAGN